MLVININLYLIICVTNLCQCPILRNYCCHSNEYGEALRRGVSACACAKGRGQRHPRSGVRAKGDAGDLERTNMFEAFRDRKLEQEQAAQDVVDVQAPAKGEDPQRKTRHPKPEIAGSSPSSPQAVMQSSHDKLRQLMETQKSPRNSPGPHDDKAALEALHDDVKTFCRKFPVPGVS